MTTTRAIVAALVLAAGCKSGSKSSGNEYKNSSPNFKVSIPAGLTQGKVKTEGDSSNLSFMSKDSSREVFMVWAKTGSQLDPQGAWSNYGHEPDNKKIIAEGKLPGDAGQWLENDRGRIFVHAVATTKDGYGVLCMASSPSDKPDRELLDACKTLTSY